MQPVNLAAAKPLPRHRLSTRARCRATRKACPIRTGGAVRQCRHGSDHTIELVIEAGNGVQSLLTDDRQAIENGSQETGTAPRLSDRICRPVQSVPVQSSPATPVQSSNSRYFCKIAQNSTWYFITIFRRISPIALLTSSMTSRAFELPATRSSVRIRARLCDVALVSSTYAP